MGRSVDDDVRLDGPHRLREAGQLGEIAAVVGAVMAQRNKVAQRGQTALQLPADLATFAEQQDLHASSDQAVEARCNNTSSTKREPT